MNDASDSEQIWNTIANKWLLKKMTLPIELIDNQISIIFNFLNNSLNQLHERKQLLLPNFSECETVAIFSDYGGESTNSKYFTYSFAFIDYNELYEFTNAMKEIRKKYKLDNPYKEIAFKDADYGPIKRCLDDYLIICNNFINGLIFTLIVDKKIISLSGKNDKSALKQLTKILKQNGYGDWKGEVAEKEQRIAQVISYFCKLLIPNDKNIFWMTDQDSIVANDEKSKATAQMILNTINSCKDHNTYNKIGYSPKPFENDKDSCFTDILSLTDLAAGSIEHYFTRNDTMDELTIKEVANKVLIWLAVQGVGLKKLTMKINEDDNIHGGFIDFHLTKPLKNAKYTDITYDIKLNENKNS